MLMPFMRANQGFSGQPDPPTAEYVRVEDIVGVSQGNERSPDVSCWIRMRSLNDRNHPPTWDQSSLPCVERVTVVAARVNDYLRGVAIIPTEVDLMEPKP